jgi:hypothetical protein
MIILIITVVIIITTTIIVITLIITLTAIIIIVTVPSSSPQLFRGAGGGPEGLGRPGAGRVAGRDAQRVLCHQPRRRRESTLPFFKLNLNQNFEFSKLLKRVLRHQPRRRREGKA